MKMNKKLIDKNESYLGILIHEKIKLIRNFLFGPFIAIMIIMFLINPNNIWQKSN